MNRAIVRTVLLSNLFVLLSWSLLVVLSSCSFPLTSSPTTIIEGTLAAPTFSLPSGTYNSAQSVTISDATAGATIYYTTDGSTPSTSSTKYSGAISLSTDGTTTKINAIATESGWKSSTEASAVYVLNFTWVTLPASSTAAGSGAYQFNGPTGVAYDAKNNYIYVADYNNNRIIRMTDMNGSNWTAFGTQGIGADEFNHPIAVAVDSSGTVYVADYNNNRIVSFTDMSGSNWTTFPPSSTTAGSGTDQFNGPASIAFDSTGRIYVTDYGNNRIVRVDDMTGTNWKVFGSSGSGADQFSGPAGIAVDPTSGQIYVADHLNDRIVRIDDMTGTNWITFGTAGSGVDELSGPMGILLNAGYIYLGDAFNGRIVRMSDMAGTGWTTFGTLTGTTNEFDSPESIAADSKGWIYVADYGNNRIARFVWP